MNAETMERNAALRALDLNWARQIAIPTALTRGMPVPTDEVLLASLHKARYECVEIEADLRHESGVWLRERGLSRQGGQPWPATEELPA